MSAQTLENWLATAARFTKLRAAESGGRWKVCQPNSEKELRFGELRVRERGFDVIAVRSPQETGPCEIFVSQTQDTGVAKRWLSGFQGRNVLTIGLGTIFCEAGGTMCLARDKHNHTAYFINTGALNTAGIHLSAHLPRHVLRKDPEPTP